MIAIIGYGIIGKIYKKLLDQLEADSCICNTSGNYIKSYKDERIANCSAAIISTPPSSHLEIAEYLSGKGVSVLVEKPAVINKKEYIELSKLIRQRPYIHLGYHTQWNPGILKVKNLVKGKPIKSIHVEYKENVTDYHDINSWIFNSSISGGGCVIDSGINILSVLQMFCNEIKVKDAELFPKGRSSIEYLAKVSASTDKSANISISIDWKSKKESRVYKFIHNDGSYTSVDLATGEIYNNSTRITSPDTMKVDHEAEYLNLVKDFLTKIQSGEHFNEQGLNPIKNVFDIYKYKK